MATRMVTVLVFVVRWSLSKLGYFSISPGHISWKSWRSQITFQPFATFLWRFEKQLRSLLKKFALKLFSGKCIQLGKKFTNGEKSWAFKSIEKTSYIGFNLNFSALDMFSIKWWRHWAIKLYYYNAPTEDVWLTVVALIRGPSKRLFSRKIYICVFL